MLKYKIAQYDDGLFRVWETWGQNSPSWLFGWYKPKTGYKTLQDAQDYIERSKKYDLEKQQFKKAKVVNLIGDKNER